MSKWLGIVCVVACFGIGCGDDDGTTADSGPATPDVPVVEVDANVEIDASVETDAGPVSCDYDGTYTVEFVSGPAAVCGMVEIESCTLVTTDGVPTVTCMYNEGEEASGECTYDAECVCTGMTTIDSEAIGEVEATIAGDFPNGTLTATALGMDCVFSLTEI